MTRGVCCVAKGRDTLFDVAFGAEKKTMNTKRTLCRCWCSLFGCLLSEVGDEADWWAQDDKFLAGRIADGGRLPFAREAGIPFKITSVECDTTPFLQINTRGHDLRLRLRF
jgi:hypothetical protein